ncbi:MAG: HDIG domain-containing metalloprotein [Candidatus Neomarinimicrobiota bacterium]
MSIKNNHEQGSKKVSIWTIISLVVIVLFSTMAVPKEQTHQYNYNIGDITRMDIIAPDDFDILKPEAAIKKERDEAIKKLAFVFSEDQSVKNQQIERTEVFFQMAKNLEERYTKYKNSQTTLRIERFTTDDLQALNQSVRTDSNAYMAVVNAMQEQFSIHAMESPFTEIYMPTEGQKIPLDTLRMNFIAHLSTLFESGVTDIPLDSIRSTQISLRQENIEKPASVKNIFDLATATDQLTENLSKDYDLHTQKLLISRIAHLLMKPNLIYDKERTSSRQQQAFNRIPQVAGKVYKDEKIVGANTLITPEIYQKLHSLKYFEEKNKENLQGFSSFISAFGDLLVISMLFMIFVLFLLIYDKSIFWNIKRFLLLMICLAISLGLGIAVALLSPAQMILVPLGITAMLLMIFFDKRIALMGSTTILLVLAYIMGGSFRFILMHAFPVVMAVVSLKNSRTRENVLRPLFFLVAGYFISVSAINIASLEGFSTWLTMMGLAMANAIVSVLVANGLMMLIEKVFGTTTSLSLLELSDMNKPLLKRLSLEAPGTFNHSIVVGNLLEAAAERIGADSLLARVGAYYHDIGKLSKTEYFVENQQGGENKLDNLKPHMAAKVIISHVRNGLELAEKEKLPEEIKDFIATHHGTMLVDYFYQKALSEAKETGDTVHESEYRYPGPKPQTKESALLMIVEASEAAVRSLPKPTPRNIETKISEVISKRLNSGQFDECPLRFADLTKIKDAIYPLLVGLYHERIPYPDDKKAEEAKDENKKDDTDISNKNIEVKKEEKA